MKNQFQTKNNGMLENTFFSYSLLNLCIRWQLSVQIIQMILFLLILMMMIVSFQFLK